jgi:hypothetical protein
MDLFKMFIVEDMKGAAVVDIITIVDIDEFISFSYLAAAFCDVDARDSVVPVIIFDSDIITAGVFGLF